MPCLAGIGVICVHLTPFFPAISIPVKTCCFIVYALIFRTTPVIVLCHSVLLSTLGLFNPNIQTTGSLALIRGCLGLMFLDLLIDRRPIIQDNNNNILTTSFIPLRVISIFPLSSNKSVFNQHICNLANCAPP
jgi:hypothetical protein